jgi:hypothetical protein
MADETAEIEPADEERDEDEEEQPAARKEPPRRDRDLLGRKNSKIRQKLDKTWDHVKRGFEDQMKRADNQMDYWNAYNCALDNNQYYESDAQIYIPIIRDAINAIATRVGNQLFPQGGRYVEVVSSDGTIPHAIVALLDHYIRLRKMKTQVCKSLIRNGYVEGQYNLYVDWAEMSREIVSRETRGPDVAVGGEQMRTPGDEIEDIEPEEINEGAPVCEVLHDSDILVLPQSADTVEEALAVGGLVAIVRRWSKSKIEQMKEAGHIRDDEADELVEAMDSISNGRTDQPMDQEKSLAELVGIRKKGAEATIWEVWMEVSLSPEGIPSESGQKRLCRAYLGPDHMQLGLVRNPNWNDRCQLLSLPVEKVAGVFKGKSQVEPVISLQYEANDAANEGADAAHYAAMPIVMRNPSAGTQPLIANIAAMWDVDPAAVKFVEWPDLTPRAITRIQYCIQQIFQSLNVNPSMLPQQTSTSRRNQAQVAQEQQVDLLTTSDAAAVLEDLLSDTMSWWVDLDYQHREVEVQVRAFGDMGRRAQMERVGPIQTRDRYEFRWLGIEAARNAAMFQQQLGFFNILRAPEIQQQLQQHGYTIDLVPVIENAAMGIFGARTAPLVIKDMRSQLTVDPAMENEWLLDGMPAPVHMLDQDQQHLQVHQQALVESGGDPHGTIRTHMMEHMQQLRMKQAAAAQQMAQQAMQQQGAQPGQPPGGGQRGGAPPRMGAQPAGPQLVKGPPGQIRPDAMPRAGAAVMPRRM